MPLTIAFILFCVTAKSLHFHRRAEEVFQLPSANL